MADFPFRKCTIQPLLHPDNPIVEPFVGCLTSEDPLMIGIKNVYYGHEDINKAWELIPGPPGGGIMMKNSGGFSKDSEDLLFVYYVGSEEAQEWVLKPQPHVGDNVFEIEVKQHVGILSKKWAVSRDTKQVQVVPLLPIEEKALVTHFRITPLLE
ncbi:hypothetical protein P691DRAFT_764005 [Macrolepiota fuliginosa MF-IS2]|uniref:Uncharacterized protein n=1 Tax=Macrolepiota fuliginosa MF-IS2 TaxID=1400762 RepID=A0A9P6BY19_9AGAR|nr:hypothetical protein P691DRAFT_764005 [Macrolepiota fuliginosa MF-IS2]